MGRVITRERDGSSSQRGGSPLERGREERGGSPLDGGIETGEGKSPLRGRVETGEVGV